MKDNGFEVSTVNREVMTTPFEKEFIEKTATKTGLVILTQKTQFAPLNVLADNADLGVKAGDVVYVQADQFKTHWASRKFDFNGMEVIMVPVDAVKMVGRK
jgi:hypothetical protein